MPTFSPSRLRLMCLLLTISAAPGVMRGDERHSARIPCIRFDSENTLLIDEKPFFTIGLYHPWRNALQPDALAEIADHGFNLAEFWGGNSNQMQVFFDTAATHGMRVFSSGATVFNDGKFVRLRRGIIKRFRRHPALLCWVFLDEPIGRGVPAAKLEKAYEALKHLDPIHPVYLCDYPIKLYTEYANATDIFAADVYPVDWAPITLIQDALARATP